ncbi:MAG: hypothetical protein HN366_14335 [Deltaproteobacteria bacterium]|jgi:hypothetical protein|nr:hypothetical protein [Deltaproteobacteria bacterium]
MTTIDTMEKKPLWLSMEECISKLSSEDLSENNREQTIHRIGKELDDTGYNVSNHGGNFLQLRWAIDERLSVGRPFMKDFMDALEALTLEDLADSEPANAKLVRDVGDAWPKIKGSERRADVLRIVEKTKLDLLIAKAKGLSGDAGIRLLIEEEIASEVIVEGLDITTEKLEQVNADIEKGLAERERVKTLLEAVENKTKEERVKHLLDNTISDALIIELAKVDAGALVDIKKSIEAELKEKQRLAEEEAAKKKAEAAGPAMEDIDPEEMLEYIESIREILEFSDQEKDIRIMCEQSSIPTSLVDVAVSDPDRLDELEKEAEG